VEFFARYLHHTKGEWAGRPFQLLEWQRRDIIEPLFGWKRQDGTRRYRTVWIEVPKKNGKSALIAGIALYMLFADGEPGAEIYSAAADRFQTRNVFEEAKRMVLMSPALRRRAEVFKYAITVPATASSYHALSSDAETKDGLNPHAALVDEVHRWRDRTLWDVLLQGMAARRQPLFIAITTAGKDRHSLCWEEHEYALKVRSGVFDDPTHLAVIYAADPSDDWTSEETWRKANPSYGDTVKPEFLREACTKAQASPARAATFKRLHLNLWTEEHVTWLDLARWDKCTVPETFDLDRLRGQPCWIGLDLASTTDLAALAAVFRLPSAPGADEASDGQPHYFVRVWCWAPADRLAELEQANRAPYVAWASSGRLLTTPGEVIDHEAIRQRVYELAAAYDVREIAADPWNAHETLARLEEEGLTVFAHRQGFASLSYPTKTFEALVLAQRLWHEEDPILRWCVSNTAVIEDPAGNQKPSKRHSSGKIDAVVAAVMALGRASLATDTPTQLLYF
jgi:phage terminase large subunit-like protein